jgi:hypothetical protein
MLSSSNVGVVLLLAGLAVVAGSSGACSGEDGPASGLPPATCVDLDGDGYGRNCTLGPDCDDNDPAVTTECLDAGCPDGGGGCAPVACTDGTTGACTITLGEHGGVKRCYEGVRVCVDGQWGPCELVDGN